MLPLTEVVKEWKLWKDLLESGEFEGLRGKGGQAIRKDWWNTGWIPFASNGGGDCFCIDLAPAASGQHGQIITMNHETGHHMRLAASFEKWLCKFAADLEEDKFRYRDEAGLE